MKINLLSSEVYNRISAGEVVENPASVVKELVENAVDAGATSINVRIEDGGIKSIEVSDNGYGIERGELPKTVLPHATSKIENVSDLDTISTLGFRGEALASIASVSEVEITTRALSEECGSRFAVKNGKSVLEDAAVVGGTTVRVSNLFYNTPARFKFLSSKSSEESKITRLMFMFILANPDVAFNYYTDNDVVYSSPGEGLKSAIDSVFLPKIADKMLKIEPYTGAENIRVSGYTGSYEIFKNNKTQQIVVLNGRIVTDSVLTATVQNAYGERLMSRCFPIYVLEIVMPFADVDVNVHPNKKEVRFAKPRAVYGAVYRAVADTLEKFDTERRGQLTESFTLNLSENAEKKTENPPRGESDAGEGSVSGGKKVSKISLQEALALVRGGDMPFGEKSASVRETISAPTSFQGFSAESGVLHGGAKSKTEYFTVSPQKSGVKPSFGKTENADGADLTILAPKIKNYRVIGQVFDTYMIVESGQKVIFIDQHAMHERIIFDDYVNELKAGVLAVQPLMIPFVYEDEPENIDLIVNASAALAECGFETERFGSDAVKISSVPAVLGKIDVKSMFEEIVSGLRSGKKDVAGKLNRDHLALAACKAAMKGGEAFTDRQIEHILDYYVAGGMPLQCPHGRPTAVVYSRSDFEKLFRRKV